MNNVKNLYRYLYPETNLFELVNKNRQEVNNPINSKNLFRGYVVEVCRKDGELKEKSKDSSIINIYPKGYIKAWIPVLDSGLSPEFARVFRPQTDKFVENLQAGDTVSISFEDDNFVNGICLGKIRSYSANDDIPEGIKIEKKSKDSRKLGQTENSSNSSVVDYKKIIEKYKDKTNETVQLTWPIYNDSKKNDSSNFGERINPQTGAIEFHPGIDIPKPAGTFVLSAQEGVVTKSYLSNDTESWIIEINHGTFITRYLHVTNVTVHVNEQVPMGAIIAEVAPKDTKSTGPHLHFEVRSLETDSNDRNVPLPPYQNSLAVLDKTKN